MAPGGSLPPRHATAAPPADPPSNSPQPQPRLPSTTPQALKQLGPSNGASNGTATSNSAANGSVLPAAAPAPAPPPGMGGMSPEQLSNLAAVLALEGVPTDVVLQTLGLPPALSAALAAPEPALPQLGGLDGTTALLAQALAASPALSSQTAFDLAARGSFDLRTSFDLGAAAAPGVAGLGSARGSLDLAALHSGLAAAAGLPNGSHMHGVDSRSTLTSVGEWSAAPSARTSLDPGTLAGLPAVSAGFLASATPLSSSLSARLSLDAALQLQQSQQQQAALLAAQAAGGAPPRHSMGGLPPLPPGGPQHNMASVMHSGFYQAGPAAPPPPPPQVQAQEVQERLAAVMSSGFYSGAAAPPPAHPPHVRHSMCEFGSASGGGLVPFGDAWAPQPQPQHAQQAQQGTLGGYSTVLRPSIDRAGLPPLPPRSPNQGAPPGGGPASRCLPCLACAHPASSARPASPCNACRAHAVRAPAPAPCCRRPPVGQPTRHADGPVGWLAPERTARDGVALAQRAPWCV